MASPGCATSALARLAPAPMGQSHGSPRPARPTRPFRCLSRRSKCSRWKRSATTPSASIGATATIRGFIRTSIFAASARASSAAARQNKNAGGQEAAGVENRLFLQQAEVDFDLSFHRHRLAVLVAGLELPLFHGFHGLFVQPQAEAAQNLHVDGFSGGVDLHIENHGALILGLAGFFS